MTNSATLTPTVSNSLSMLITGAVVTLHYTTYKGWSGKTYGVGRVSGVSAVPAKMEVTIGKVTDKAYQLVDDKKRTCWVPKSRVSVNEKSGRFVVNRGFCYFAGNFPDWKAAYVPRTFNPVRTTML